MPDAGFTRSYTAHSGDRVILPCPIQPGALLQYYSVIWTKDSNEIANSQNSVTTNGKYGIDRSTYSLIIDPVDANDTSPSYQCQVYVHNPTTDIKQQLHYYPQTISDVSLQLTVISNKQELHCDPQTTTEASLSLTVLSSCKCKVTLLFRCST